MTVVKFNSVEETTEQRLERLAAETKEASLALAREWLAALGTAQALAAAVARSTGVPVGARQLASTQAVELAGVRLSAEAILGRK